jgi:hypothetical protein
MVYLLPQRLHSAYSSTLGNTQSIEIFYVARRATRPEASPTSYLLLAAWKNPLTHDPPRVCSLVPSL